MKPFEESGGISVLKGQRRKGKWTPCALKQRAEGASRLFSATSPKARLCDGMGLYQSSVMVWGGIRAL